MLGFLHAHTLRLGCVRGQTRSRTWIVNELQLASSVGMNSAIMRRAIILSLALVNAVVFARVPIKLASDLAVSPDGKQIAFFWRGDVWAAPMKGGAARQLTRHPAVDRQPAWSPDGKKIAFMSEREGGRQVWVMPATGGAPRKLTTHTEGFTLEEWMPGGKGLLTSVRRDHFWRHSDRFMVINATTQQEREQAVFDAYGNYASVSADGKRILYNREGERWWRKGYIGSRTAQVWLWDAAKKTHTQLLVGDDARWPTWKPDGKKFYYAGARGGSALNLREYDLDTKKDRQITKFTDDSVVFPAISRDGSVIAFRRLFDFYYLKPGLDEKPTKINLFAPGDVAVPRVQRRVLSKATEAAFSKDGLELAVIAGGDVWVMDTELREPVQVTSTPEEESNPVWHGDELVFLSGQGGQVDVWQASRADAKKYWWQNDAFKLKRLTNDAATEYGLTRSPDGGQFGFLKERGDFWVMDAKTQKARRVFKSWNAPQYDWSPDGKWIVYALSDNDFNRDIWLRPLDGSREPFNLSRHPDNEYNPRWSPDGKKIAFTGRRRDQEVDIFYVYLRAEDDEENSRARRLAKALEKMKKGRPPKPASKPEPPKEEPKKEEPKKPEPKKDEKKPDAKPEAKPAKPALKIDFEGIHERIRSVSIPDSSESGLFWSSDSKKLAFSATVADKRGTYTVTFPDSLKPTLLTATTGTAPRWVGANIRWLANGAPGTLSATGRPTSYAFKAQQEFDLGKRYRAAFDMCWRAMRDHFYDDALGNRDWTAIRKKYAPMAEAAPDGYALTLVVSLMLGELNGSHLGFSYRGPETAPTAPTPGWTDTTAHLGVRFASAFKGAGLRIRDIIPDGPAGRVESQLKPGEVITHVSGKKVGPKTDLVALLTGRLDRDIELTVKAGPRAKASRKVTLRPITYGTARSKLYEKWIRDNRAMVDKLSGGKHGYLHIAGMNMSSFYRFEEELYSVGAGKDGIVIDVRENGGGFTTDHLLTILTQPRHAITVPRGGGRGYPQDRKVYASWHKPIVVLCNQNSYSNAEIFSHAIKHLKRGKVVGVTTAGGVISTGGRNIMDLGFLRMPFRGWYLLGTGEDMELHGAVPHVQIWPKPGDWPAGRDSQLRRAVSVLKKDVAKYKARKQPDLLKASGRPKKK